MSAAVTEDGGQSRAPGHGGAILTQDEFSGRDHQT